MDMFDRGYNKRINRYKKNNQTELIAYMLSKYYEYYNEYGNNGINYLLDESLKKLKYTEETKKQLLQNSITILKLKYNIVIVSEDPLILNKLN